MVLIQHRADKNHTNNWVVKKYVLSDLTIQTIRLAIQCCIWNEYYENSSCLIELHDHTNDHLLTLVCDHLISTATCYAHMTSTFSWQQVGNLNIPYCPKLMNISVFDSKLFLEIAVLPPNNQPIELVKMYDYVQLAQVTFWAVIVEHSVLLRFMFSVGRDGHSA